MSVLQDEEKVFMNNHSAAILKYYSISLFLWRRKSLSDIVLVGVSCFVMLNCSILCQRTKYPRVYMNCQWCLADLKFNSFSTSSVNEGKTKQKIPQTMHWLPNQQNHGYCSQFLKLLKLFVYWALILMQSNRTSHSFHTEGKWSWFKLQCKYGAISCLPHTQMILKMCWTQRLSSPIEIHYEAKW